jgi:Ca2+-binding RTX toxin-like protein
MAAASVVMPNLEKAVAESCTFPVGHTVSISFSSYPDEGLAASGAQITWNGMPCSGATVANTDTINATGSGNEDGFFVDLRGGPFAPGFTDEGDGASEIEIKVNAGADFDVLATGGTALSDFLVLGVGGYNLNGDSDADVFFSETEETTLLGFEGNDVLTASGGFGTGGAIGTFAGLAGQRGNDRLMAGKYNSHLAGGPGHDIAKGGPGEDVLLGGVAADKLSGRGGDDVLAGYRGNDRLNGGSGIDVCLQGPGTGPIRSCEEDRPQ